jgi:hypothetical protein
MCQKILYPTAGEAREAAHGISKRSNNHTLPYYCDLCEGWHITRSDVHSGKPKAKKTHTKRAVDIPKGKYAKADKQWFDLKREFGN